MKKILIFCLLLSGQAYSDGVGIGGSRVIEDPTTDHTSRGVGIGGSLVEISSPVYSEILQSLHHGYGVVINGEVFQPEFVNLSSRSIRMKPRDGERPIYLKMRTADGGDEVFKDVVEKALPRLRNENASKTISNDHEDLDRILNQLSETEKGVLKANGLVIPRGRY